MRRDGGKRGVERAVLTKSLRDGQCAQERKVKLCDAANAHGWQIVGLATAGLRMGTEGEVLRRPDCAQERKVTLCEGRGAHGNGK